MRWGEGEGVVGAEAPTLTSSIYHTLCIKFLHPILIDLPRTITGTAWAKHEDPQCGPLPLAHLSLSPFRFRLQTIYRPVLHIFRLFPQYLFLLLRGIHATTTPSPPTPTDQVNWDGGNPYDLECVEIWERFACDNQVCHCRAYPPSRVDQSSRSCVLDIIFMMEDYGKFGEPWTRSHKFWSRGSIFQSSLSSRDSTEYWVTYGVDRATEPRKSPTA